MGQGWWRGAGAFWSCQSHGTGEERAVGPGDRPARPLAFSISSVRGNTPMRLRAISCDEAGRLRARFPVMAVRAPKRQRKGGPGIRSSRDARSSRAIFSCHGSVGPIRARRGCGAMRIVLKASALPFAPGLRHARRSARPVGARTRPISCPRSEPRPSIPPARSGGVLSGLPILLPIRSGHVGVFHAGRILPR